MYKMLQHPWIEMHFSWERGPGVVTPEGLYSIGHIEMAWQELTRVRVHIINVGEGLPISIFLFIIE